AGWRREAVGRQRKLRRRFEVGRSAVALLNVAGHAVVCVRVAAQGDAGHTTGYSAGEATSDRTGSLNGRGICCQRHAGASCERAALRVLDCIEGIQAQRIDELERITSGVQIRPQRWVSKWVDARKASRICFVESVPHEAQAVLLGHHSELANI